MKQFFLGLFVVCSICVTGRGQASATYNDYHAGKRYDFEISAELLAKTPVWSENEDCPPLAARAAIKIAKAQMGKLFDDADKWSNRSFQLTQLGERWVYLVEFMEPIPPGATEHLSSPFRVPVLMDGETVEPKVSPWKH